MKIAYIFASRSRPKKFFDCLNNIRDMSESKDYFVWAKLDLDDETMNNDEVKERLKEYPEVTVKWGMSNNKIHAINRSLSDLPHYDILCNHSDDMWLTSYGFDNDIREAFEGWDGLVHFPDQKAGEQLITYAMMHRDYYNLHGYIYHPDFMNVYCDNFQQWQAQQLGKYKLVNKNILEHRHFIWGFGEKDALLTKTEDPTNYGIDHNTFERLKKEFAI